MRYVVIDFEASCDEPYNPEPQEIIEFPAVVVDLESGKAVGEFASYVRPVAHPRLTSFCVGLTGIRQEQVNRARPFLEVLKQFESWLRGQCPEEYLCVTCGDWDLGSLLPRQCAQHRLPVPEWANRWANLKRIFAWHFPHAADKTGLPAMADSFGLPLIGRLHSGIDDARNIARIVQRLLVLGVSVDNTAFWRCLGCGTENLYRVRECSACRRSSVSLRVGDWACPGCGFGNFAQRDKCFECGVPRAGAGGGAAHTPDMKPGDWMCGECGEHNFARRRNCFKCGSIRELPFGHRRDP